MTEVNAKVKEFLQKIRDGPPYQTTQETDWYLGQYNRLRELLENLPYPLRTDVSLQWQNRDGSLKGTLIRMGIKVKKIRVLKTGWIDITAEGPQHPPLRGWAKNFNQLVVRNSTGTGVENVEN